MNLIIIFTAQYVFLINIFIFLSYVAYLWLRQRKSFHSFLLLSVVSFPLSLAIAKILARFIYEPRPFVVDHTKPLIAHVADNGFPSDHVLLTTTIAAVIFAFNKKLGTVLFVVTLLIGAARVVAGVHHPLDIFGSMVIAIAVTAVTYSFLPVVRSRFVSRL